MAWDDAPPTKAELVKIGGEAAVAPSTVNRAPMSNAAWDSAPPSPAELQAAPPSTAPISKLESGARGLAQGATLGFADEIAGAGEAAGDVLKSPGDYSKLIDLYKKHRDESRANFSAAQAANPKTYLAGELGGGAAAMMVPGLGEAEALQGVKGAATLGAAAGLGGSQADLTQGDVGGAVKDTALGAGMGALGGAAAEAVNPAMQSLLNKAGAAAKETAGSQALKVLKPGVSAMKKEAGIADFPTAENVFGVGEGKLAKAATDNNILNVRGGYAKTLQNIDDALLSNRQKFKPILDDVADKVSAKAAQNPDLSMPATPGSSATQGNTVKDQFVNLAQGEIDNAAKGMGGDANAAAIQKAAQGFAGKLNGADYDIKALNDLKQTLGKQLSDAQWGKAADDLAPIKGLIRKTYGLVKGRIEDLADNVSPGVGQQIKDLNQEYGSLMTLRGSTAGKAAAEAQGTASAAGSIIPGGAMGAASGIAGAAMTGHGMLGALGVGAVKGIEGATQRDLGTLGQIMSSRTLNSISDTIANSSQPGSNGLAAKLLAIAKNPDVQARTAAVTAAMQDPMAKQQIQDAATTAQKDVSVRPNTATAPTPKGRGYTFSPSSQDLTNMQARLPQDGSSTTEHLTNIFKSMQGKDQIGRNAMIFSLMQNPAFRPSMDKLMGEHNDEQ